MYLRTIKKRNKDGSYREYLCVVESQWVNGTSKQKIVGSLGRLDILKEKGVLENLAEKMAAMSEKLLLINLAKTIGQKIKRSKEYGVVIVFRRIWEELGYERILKKYLTRTEKQFNAVEAILAMVINRLVAPFSKRKIHKWKEKVYEPRWKEFKISDLSRALDFLVENKEESEVENGDAEESTQLRQESSSA